MIKDKLQALELALDNNILSVRVDADRAALAVLSDVHTGLNNVDYFKKSVDFLLSLGENCKVILGGDSTNTTTKHSKGNVLEEFYVGDEQIQEVVDLIKPLFDSGQLIGIVQGNHGARAYNDAYITPEKMIACLLGKRELFLGEMGIIYFNVRKNCYVHNILHKHRKAKNFYDYFNADVTWHEHFHEPSAIPKIIVEHNKYTKKPIVKQAWDLWQGSFQTYPSYAKENGMRPQLSGYWVCEMDGGKSREIIPHLDHNLHSMVERGYTLC